MAQKLRALVILTEDLGLVPSTHREANNSVLKESNALFWPLRATGMHTVHIHMQAKQSYI